MHRLIIELSENALKELARFIIYRHHTGNTVGPDYEFCQAVCRAFRDKEELLSIIDFSKSDR